jgi:ribonuclease E
MTPDEQRVYALMGVSPLVLAPAQKTQDLPRNLVISVVTPGQSVPGQTGWGANVPAAQPALSPTITDQQDLNGDTLPLANSNLGTLSSIVAGQLPLEDLLAATDLEPEADALVRRRRRRRTSSDTEETNG